ncbi:MAG: hypothetical protein F4Y57_08960 [Acidobacteria bacterium]|nr:hypothetical protein [Acidobacteriota bacterium]
MTDADETTDAERLAAGRALVDRFAPGAPESIKTTAAKLVARSMVLGPEVSIAHADQRIDFGGTGDRANLLRRSGAAGILAPWRRPRSRPIKGDDD